MVSLASLWLPILLSAVFVFIASSIIHMLLTYHRSNFSGLPDEAAFRNAVKPLNIPPGEYMIPHAPDLKSSASEEYLQRSNEGPVGLITLLPNGPWPMGKSLGLWFIYCLIVGAHSGYLGSTMIPAGADYLAVMRVVGAAAFAGYALALIQNSVWRSTPWSTTFKFMIDGFIYALLTGGTFGWLWPSV